MFLDESPLSLDLWLRSMGLSSISSQDAPNASEEIMVPPFDSEHRLGSAWLSKAAIIATLIGSNGSLGMPYAFERCGVALTVTLIMVIAIATDRTMYLFWMCARKTGANTYGGVVRSTLGHRVHCVTSAFLFLYLLLMISQNMRSVYNILTPLCHLYLPSTSLPLILVWLPIVVLCGLAFHPLRLMVYIGVGSLIALLGMLFYFQFIHAHSDGDAPKILPETVNDSVLGFNMLLRQFVASYNILYVQSELSAPTAPLMGAVVRQGILGSGLLAIAIGCAGYRFLQWGGINNAIPLNFLDHASIANKYPALQLVSFLAIFCASPLVLIPCRDYLLDTIETFVLDGHCPSDISDCQDDIETWTTRSSTRSGGSRSTRPHKYNNLVNVDEETHLLPAIEEDSRCDLHMNPYVRYGSIAAILAVGQLLAWSETAVPFFWNLMSPSLTLIFAQIVPAACYLEAYKRETQGYKMFGRWVIVISIMLCLVCTVSAIRDVL
jgi:Transmembrane amino acid transporter protein